MPYTFKTKRRTRRHLVTLKELNRANRQVTGEMESLGLWHPRLDSVEVWLVPASPSCYGWHQGDIHIPAFSGAQLSDLLSGYRTRLTDILRHEWAHALAHRRPSLIRTRRFRETFGGPYDSTRAAGKYDPAFHLTPYAASSPCEDFAETFHFYLRHKGRLPKGLKGRPVIARKWRYIAAMAKRLAAAA
jgi:hypothetical protein